nr:MAG TPA: hypothetical protein [Caudoviricetes sp.]
MNNEGHCLWNPEFPILSCCHILTVFCGTFVFTSFLVKNFVDGFNLSVYFLESSVQGTYLLYQDSCILRLFLRHQENIPCQTLTYWELPWLLIRESFFLSQTMYSLLSYTF